MATFPNSSWLWADLGPMGVEFRLFHLPREFDRVMSKFRIDLNFRINCI